MIGTQSNQVVSLATRRQPARILMSEPPISEWREAVMERLQELLRLEYGWDGYYGMPVRLENAVFALRMLEAACDADTTAPQIVPGAEGDLQIEWHTLSGDLELHVKGPNDVHAWRLMARADAEEEELDLRTDFLAVARWIEDVTETSIAADAAAA